MSYSTCMSFLVSTPIQNSHTPTSLLKGMPNHYKNSSGCSYCMIQSRIVQIAAVSTYSLCDICLFWLIQINHASLIHVLFLQNSWHPNGFPPLAPHLRVRSSQPVVPMRSLTTERGPGHSTLSIFEQLQDNHVNMPRSLAFPETYCILIWHLSVS